jgi:hypothetical protein
MTVSGDGRMIFHAANSRCFRCLCGKLQKRWVNNDAQI